MDRKSRSTSRSRRKDNVRHVTISSSSTSSSRSRSRSLSSLSRSRSRSGSRYRRRKHRRYKRRHHSSSRSRSRSRHGSRSKSRKSRSVSLTKVAESAAKRTGYLGTNSRDPKMVASRIFIGNLPMSDVSDSDLEAIYGRYGRILGIKVKPGFGFIQFENEQDALSAVAGEKGSSLKGFLLDVKIATEGRAARPDGEAPEGETWKPPPGGYMPPRPPLPLPGMVGYRPPSIPGHPMHLPPGPPPPGYFGPPMPPFPRGPLPPPDHFRRFPDYPPHDYGPPRGLPPVGRPPAVPSPPAVDCEILVTDGKRLPYAEGIKKCLMAAGVVTEMNIVPDIDIPMAIDAAARRRLLFAITVNEQNEVHHSITVNILHGIPQEHRNMPLDDAVTLITRSYDKYMLERKERVGVAPPQAEQEFLPPGPRVQYLLNLLADQRFLTIPELTAVMDYLDDRRRAMLVVQEKGRSLPPFSRVQDVDSRKSLDALDSRRMDMDDRDRLPAPGDLGKDRRATSSDVSRDRLAPAADLIWERLSAAERDRYMQDIKRDRMLQGDMIKPAPGEAAEYDRPSSSVQPPDMSIAKILSTSINFDNPSVKQALDNLLSGGGQNIFKSVSDSSGQKASGGSYTSADIRH